MAAARGATWAAVLGLATVAIVVGWRRRHGRTSRLTALAALAGPSLAVLVASRVVDIPLL